MEAINLSINDIHDGLKKKKFSAVELSKAFLDNIQKKDKNISSFLTLVDSLALSQAKKIDEKIDSGKEIPLLAGVPVAVKDNILIEGLKTTCGSKILEDYVAPYDATCIKKLKDLGAVILGKTNMDEFAMGASTEHSAFFPTKNPIDLKRVPGGSSGGSAAAVAADFCSYALGSDTGGSIRLPASFCGVVGLKPTYGAVSRYGLVAFGSSLDQIGSLTKTVEDSKIVFGAISGKDPKDSTSIDYRNRKLNQGSFKISDLRIGVPKEYFIDGIDENVKKIVRSAIGHLESLGAKVEEISLPHTKYANPVYYLTCTSEASANLARYDGIKYGLSISKNNESKPHNLLDVYLQTRQKGFGLEVKRRIMLGTYALSSGYYDAYYLKAQRVRTLIKEDFEKAFKTVDVIMTPVSPTPAFKIGEKIDDPLLMYLSDIFTVSVNLAGLPAVSVPAGQAKELPVGVQIIGKPFDEYTILETGKLIEKYGGTN